VAAASLAQVVIAEDSIEAQYLGNVRQVTSDFLRAGEGYFSPDMSTIIYQAITREYPFYQIFTQPLAGGDPRLVSTGRGRTTCSYFAPDRPKILFSSSHLDPKLDETEAAERAKLAEEARTGKRRRYSWVFDPHMDIFEADPDGSKLRRLTDDHGYDAEGAYSPDGRLIAFCSTRDGDPDLYVMNADGSNVRQLTDSPGYDGGPFISPDNRWVVFRTDRKREDYLQIHAVRIDGACDVALTDNEGVNWAPYWHPTDSYIIWAGADHSNPNVRPNYDLWLMRYEISERQLAPGPLWRITDHPSADVLPVFSPDGKKLMWTSSRTTDRSPQLWIADFTPPKHDASAEPSPQ
jgi:Tol biopolymer transport system component